MGKKSKLFQALLLVTVLITSLNVAIPNKAKAATACGVTGVTSGNKVYYIFKNVGVCEWTRPAGVTSAEYLLVGGGGGGGGGRGGGGGGGGVLTGTWITLNEYSAFNIWVGAGGSGGPSTQRGVNGGYSAIVPPDFGTPGLYLWAGGGGGGGSGNTNGSISYGGNADGLAGASISQVRGNGGGAGFNFAAAGTRYWGLGGVGSYNGGNTYLCTPGDVIHDSNRSTGGGGGAGAYGGGFGTAGVSLPTQCGYLAPPFEKVYQTGFSGNSYGGSGKTDSLINQIGPISNITGSYAGSPTFSYFFGGGGGGSDGRGSYETGYNALGAGTPGEGGGGYGEIKQSGSADYFSAGKANTGGGGGGGLGTGAAGGSGLVVLVVTKSTPTISYASSLKTAMLKKRSNYTLPAISYSPENGLGVNLSTSPSSVCTISGTTIYFVDAGTCTITAATSASEAFNSTSRNDSIQIINNNTQNVQSVKLVDPQTTGSTTVNLTKPNIRDPYSGTYDVHTCVDVVSGPAATTASLTSDVYIGINGSYDASKVSIGPGLIRINASKSLTDTYLNNLYIMAVGATKLTKVNNSSLYILIRTNLIADSSVDALSAYCDDENRNWIQIKSTDLVRSRTNISVSRPVHR